MNIGYIRVSSCGQRTDRQLEGVALDRVFMDKTSGKDMDRPEFQACLRALQAGDMLHVHSIDRLTRSLQDLLAILEDMADRNVTVKFYKENLIFSGESSPFQRLHLQIIGAVAEFERALIRERQREGIALAKQPDMPPHARIFALVQVFFRICLFFQHVHQYPATDLFHLHAAGL